MDNSHGPQSATRWESATVRPRMPRARADRAVAAFGSLLIAVLLLTSRPLRAQAPPGTTPSSQQSAKTSQTTYPVEVLVQSPAATATDLQVICLFRSIPANTLHGSLSEIDEKSGGLLSAIRKDGLFSGDLGETLLLEPKAGTLSARRVLLIGLGDLESFSPQREQLIGYIVFEESQRLGIRHPFFAPTVLDGGKSGIDTGDTAEQFLLGYLRAQAAESLLRQAGASAGDGPERLTFLAGAAHAASTRAGIARALQESRH